MTIQKEILTTKLFSKEVVEQNKEALDIVRFYTRVSDIVERTYIAMGKRSSYRVTNSGTKNQKLNTNAYASTH
jgi:hypothetical protein